MLKGKKIVLGITGSIAAYKACNIIRLLVKSGAEVQVVITPAGKEFITPITLSALTQKPVISDFFSQRDGTWHSHVALGLWADAMLVAPCTASTLGKMAHGIADTSVTMAVKSHLRNGRPVVLAVSTNDALAVAAENIGKLLARKHIYFVPFGQDDAFQKPTSMISDFTKIAPAVDAALEGRQLQPILLEG